MALTIANLAFIRNDPSASSYVSPSISPTPGNIILVWVLSVDAQASPHPTPTLSGNGITWNQLGTAVSATFVGTRGTLFGATVPVGASSGSLTIDFGGTNVLGIMYSVDQVSPTAGNALLLVQNQTVTAGGTNPSLTLASTPFIESVVLGYVGRPNSSNYTAGAGFTLLNVDNGTGGGVTLRALASEYRLSSTSTTVSFTSGNHADAKLAAAEIEEVFVVNMPGAGDIAATATSTAQGAALLTGLGDLSATTPVIPTVVRGARPTIGSVDPILDDSIGRLGCGTAGAFITGQCGYPTVCVLDNITEIEWDRRLDDVSEALVRIGLSGDSNSACCECLDDIEPWCNELHITRNGIEEWCGPVTMVTYTYGEVIIKAIDMVGWLGVKVPAVNSNFGVATNLTDIAFTSANSILKVALTETNACILNDVQSYPNAVTGIRAYQAYGATSLEYLNDLAHNGLNYTTLGRSIILSGQITQLRPLIILRDEHIMGEVEFVKNGLLAGNRYYIHYQNDIGIPAVYSGLTPYCYGRIERMRTESDVTTVANAQAIAQSYVTAAQIAPRTLSIPSGSRLHPETPWTIGDMVCGARIDVQISNLCFKVQQSFILTQMKLIETPAEGEQILITLAPINDVGLGAG